MKRIVYAFITFAAVLAVFGCNRELGGELSVSPTSLEFGGDAETQTLIVNASSSWTTAMSSDVKWCTLSKTYGKASETIEVSVTANSDTERSVTLYFNTVGGKPVSVTVTQAPGTAESGPAYDNSVQGEFYPEASSGISVTDAIFATQMVDGEEEREIRKKLIKRGNSLLEKLEEIRDALLVGYIEKEKLIDIARLINEHKVESSDPKLQEIIAEIELRIEVEIAKLTR